MPRCLLSCCIVVKNEEKKIIPCLNKIDILADEIVIVDTGSSDRTLQAVNYWVTQKKAQKNVKVIKVGNRFHDKDGDFNFGEAKTFAFSQATKDFVMWLDVSDQVSDQKSIKKKFIEETSKDLNVYFVLPTALSKSFAYNRTRIGNREYAKMDGRIHETMKLNTDIKLRRVFIPVVINNFKQKRDLKRNIRSLKKEWELKKDGRSCFYIANTCRELRDMKSAYKWFIKRTTEFDYNEDFKEEHYKALECMCEIALQVKKSDFLDIEDLFGISKSMIEKDSSRLEGYFYLAKYYMEKKEWENALNELYKCKKCKAPEIYKLWLNNNLYKGSSIVRSIETCNTAMKYKEVLQPEQILDYQQPMKSKFTIGSSQYY